MNLDPFAMIDSLQKSSKSFSDRSATADNPNVALQYAIIASVFAELSGALLEGVRKASGR